MTLSHITKNIFIILCWTIIGGLSFYFFMDNVAAYFFGYRSRIFGDTFFQNQFFVITHLAGGSITLLLGPFQFSAALRKRYMKLHRLSGLIYITGAAITGLSALRLSLISPCFPCRISLFLLATLMLLTTVLAWFTIKNRKIELHRKFMVRSYVLILSFVLVRLDDILPLDYLFGIIEDATFRRVVNEYFFSFVPLIFTEVVLSWVPAFRNKAVFN